MQYEIPHANSYSLLTEWAFRKALQIWIFEINAVAVNLVQQLISQRIDAHFLTDDTAYAPSNRYRPSAITQSDVFTAQDGSYGEVIDLPAIKRM
jgi:hypothetical protein